MKRNLKVPAAIAAVCIVAVICVIGGKVAADAVYADKLAQTKAATDKAASAQKTKAPTIMAPLSTLNPDATPAPKPTGETVTVEENGDITIRPDWSQNIADPNAPSNTTAEGNMGGSGGGKVDLPSNSEQPATPAPTPTPTKSPQTTPAVPETTPTPTEAPQVTPSSTPAPTATPTPEKPDSGNSDPYEGCQGGTTPKPSHNGYNGEISADGEWGWIDGFGWVPNGNGSHSEPGKGEFTPEDGYGETIGIM